MPNCPVKARLPMKRRMLCCRSAANITPQEMCLFCTAFWKIWDIMQETIWGGILDAPCDGTACKWGVKDAAPYAQETMICCFTECFSIIQKGYHHFAFIIRSSLNDHLLWGTCGTTEWLQSFAFSGMAKKYLQCLHNSYIIFLITTYEIIHIRKENDKCRKNCMRLRNWMSLNSPMRISWQRAMSCPRFPSNSKTQR